MADQLAEIAAIAGNPQAPDFENTLVAMERSGALLRRVARVFFNQSAADTNDERPGRSRPRSRRGWPRTRTRSTSTGRSSRVSRPCTTARESLPLPDGEAQRLIEKYHEEFVRAGAELDGAQQERLRELNAELATLRTTFQRNLLADTRPRALVLDDAAELAGLSEDGVAAAAENGKALGHEGKYVLSLKLFSNQSELATLENREVRRRLLEASVGRGFESNREVIRQIVMLRAERAALLGFASHAAYAVGDQTAGSVEAVEGMLGRLVSPAVANARKEAEALRRPTETRRSRRGTGSTTRRRCASPSTTSTPPRCALTWSCRASCTGRRLLRRRPGLRPDLHRAPRSPGLPPGRARVRGLRRATAARWACSSATSTRASPSAAAPG